MSRFLHHVFLVGHLVGLVFGLGGATVTDVLFVKMVRARRAGRSMLVVVETASSMVRSGYLLLVGSGVGLLATGSPMTSRWAVKMTVVVVIGVNGLMAHRVVFPKMRRKVTMAVVREEVPGVSLDFLHQLSIVAAVSGASWWAALVIGSWKTTSLPWYMWEGGYLIVLFAAVSFSMIATPHLLHAEDPGFETVFPTLRGPALRAVAMRRLPVSVQRQLPPPEVER